MMSDPLNKAREYERDPKAGQGHTFASALLSAGGFGLSDVGALLGHADPETTERCKHKSDERQRAAADAAGKELSK
jgi:integrase